MCSEMSLFALQRLVIPAAVVVSLLFALHGLIVFGTTGSLPALLRTFGALALAGAAALVLRWSNLVRPVVERQRARRR